MSEMELRGIEPHLESNEYFTIIELTKQMIQI